MSIQLSCGSEPVPQQVLEQVPEEVPEQVLEQVREEVREVRLEDVPSKAILQRCRHAGCADMVMVQGVVLMCRCAETLSCLESIALVRCALLCPYSNLLVLCRATMLSGC